MLSFFSKNNSTNSFIKKYVKLNCTVHQARIDFKTNNCANVDRNTRWPFRTFLIIFLHPPFTTNTKTNRFTLEWLVIRRMKLNLITCRSHIIKSASLSFFIDQQNQPLKIHWECIKAVLYILFKYNSIRILLRTFKKKHFFLFFYFIYIFNIVAMIYIFIALIYLYKKSSNL